MNKFLKKVMEKILFLKKDDTNCQIRQRDLILYSMHNLFTGEQQRVVSSYCLYVEYLVPRNRELSRETESYFF